MARKIRRLMMVADVHTDGQWDDVWNSLNKVLQMVGSKLGTFSIRQLEVEEGAPITSRDVVFTETTMLKVHAALQDANVPLELIEGAINHMQNHGILFRENA